MPSSEGQLCFLPKMCESSVSLDRARNGTHIFYGWGRDRSFASAPAWPESAQTDVNAPRPLPYSHADPCLLQTAVELLCFSLTVFEPPLTEFSSPCPKCSHRR